jgi:endonuclease YncB( thermonuclease family)
VGAARRGRSAGRLGLAGALAAWLAVAAAGVAAAEEFRGRVVGVPDGDTLRVLRAGRAEVVRLQGIDAPERGQPYATRARAFTAALAAGRTVTVRVALRDRYGRHLGEVTLPGGRRLGPAVVRAGYAWWFRRYSADRVLADAEAAARAEGIGLWADPRPVPPWSWRAARARPAGAPAGRR